MSDETKLPETEAPSAGENTTEDAPANESSFFSDFGTPEEEMHDDVKPDANGTDGAKDATETNPMAATEPVDVSPEHPEDAPMDSTSATENAMSTEADKMSGEHEAEEEKAPGTSGQGEGVQVSETSGIENPEPEEKSKEAVEPEATGAPLLDTENNDGDFEKDIQALVADAGNAIYAAEKAFEDVGKIINEGTTAAFIKILQPRFPAAEAAGRAAATEAGLASGDIKPEDAPGAQGAKEGEEDGLSVDGPDSGNSRTGATGPKADPLLNPTAPVQVGDKGTVEHVADKPGAEKDVVGGEASEAHNGSAIAPDETKAEDAK